MLNHSANFVASFRSPRRTYSAPSSDQKLGEFVDPGIGGSVYERSVYERLVYERLGFADKNSYVPVIVAERRQGLAA